LKLKNIRKISRGDAQKKASVQEVVLSFKSDGRALDGGDERY
jgi:hypothetical protein